jgi:hypothetical protein
MTLADTLPVDGLAKGCAIGARRERLRTFQSLI